MRTPTENEFCRTSIAESQKANMWAFTVPAVQGYHSLQSHHQPNSTRIGQNQVGQCAFNSQRPHIVDKDERLCASGNIYLHGTITENIALDWEKINLPLIRGIRKKVRLTEWAASFPEGTDTVLSEAGRKLSGSQKQPSALPVPCTRKTILLLERLPMVSTIKPRKRLTLPCND